MADDLITVPIGEAFRRISGIGRTRQYELIESGDLESIMLGKRRLIVVASYRRLVERQRSLGPGRAKAPCSGRAA